MIGYLTNGISLGLLLVAASSYAANGGDIPAQIVQVEAGILSSKAKLAHLKYLEKMASPEDKGSWAKQAQWENTQIADGENNLAALHSRLAREAPDWLKSMGEDPFPAAESSLAYLQEHFPKAERLSSMHWQSIRNQFGAAIEEAFLQKTYHVNELSLNQKKTKRIDDVLIVFVHDPFIKFSSLMNNVRWHNVKKEMLTASLSQEEISLQRSGYKTKSFDASAFSSLDDLASEFGQFIEKTNASSGMRLLLISTGEGSAIVHRYLDLHSGSRRNTQITAWINYNGRLHGLPIAVPADREIASVERKTPLEKQEEEFACNLLQLQEERGMGNPSLGGGFKIFNFVNWNQGERPTAEIQDAFESNATSFIIRDHKKPGDLEQIILSAIP